MTESRQGIADPGGEAGDSSDALAAFRSQGVPASERVRFHFIEALARRAARHEGETRRLLDARVAKALSDHQVRLRSAGQAEGQVQEVLQDAKPSALAELVRRLDASSSAWEGLASAEEGSPAMPSSAELKTLSHFRATWSKLSVSQRLKQSLHQAPGDAGPLNSHGLAVRALKRMQEISPAYVERFVSYFDALVWLERATAKGFQSPAQGVPAGAERKPKSGRGRRK